MTVVALWSDRIYRCVKIFDTSNSNKTKILTICLDLDLIIRRFRCAGDGCFGFAASAASGNRE